MEWLLLETVLNYLGQSNDLVHTAVSTTKTCLDARKPAIGLCRMVESLREHALNYFCNAGCKADGTVHSGQKQGFIMKYRYWP